MDFEEFQKNLYSKFKREGLEDAIKTQVNKEVIQKFKQIPTKVMEEASNKAK